MILFPQEFLVNGYEFRDCRQCMFNKAGRGCRHPAGRRPTHFSTCANFHRPMALPWAMLRAYLKNILYFSQVKV